MWNGSTLSARGGRRIEAELAGVPVIDQGEVLGDLTGVRLQSTNPQANCNTILCSETVGCMRMESGGSAQSSLVQEVTSLSDQRSDLLLEQQLQRWGEDVLFEESLAMTSEILDLMAQQVVRQKNAYIAAEKARNVGQTADFRRPMDKQALYYFIRSESRLWLVCYLKSGLSEGSCRSRSSSLRGR